MKPPREKLAALEAAAASLNRGPLADLLRLAEVMGGAVRRGVDGEARNHPEAARLAARMKAGALRPGEGDELFSLTAEGRLPEGFLATVQRLADSPAKDNRQACYLVALVRFRANRGEWPGHAEADHYACENFPELFADMGHPSIDGKDGFKRLRKQLGLDWLPRKRGGRPRKGG